MLVALLKRKLACQAWGQSYCSPCPLHLLKKTLLFALVMWEVTLLLLLAFIL